MTTVVWTVTDASGLTATCDVVVTVNDTQAPTITCGADATRAADAGVCTYTVVGTEFNSSATSDNCAVTSITNNFTNSSTLAGAVLPSGATTVVWTVTDASGLTATCDVVRSEERRVGKECRCRRWRER